MSTTDINPMRQTVRPGAIVCRTDNKGHSRNLDGRVVDEQNLTPDPDMFVINTGTDISPFFTFGRLTGRTRRMWGTVVPTIERFEVETTAREVEGVWTVVGVPGDKITGTFVTRPENVIDRPRPMFEAVGLVWVTA